MKNRESAGPGCSCQQAGPSPRAVSTRRIGVDETAGRYGEVSIWTCRDCRGHWLHYAVRYGLGPVGEKTVIGRMPVGLHLLHASAAETVMNACSPVFAWMAGSHRSNWTPLAGRVRLGMRR